MLRTPVSVYMTREPTSVPAGATLEQAAALLDARRVSAMPIVDDAGTPVGVVSRRDLLKVGRRRAPDGRAIPEWELPDGTVDSVMSTEILSVAPSTSIGEAAALMLDRHVHRVFVDIDRQLRGVLTTRDVMRAIHDAHLDAPAMRFASKPAQTVVAWAPLDTARRQLEELNVRGLIVLRDGEPVGIFAEEESLEARHREANTTVEEVMGHELLIVAPETPIQLAAARMASMHARRMAVMRGDELVGVLTGFDLAGAAAIEGG